MEYSISVSNNERAEINITSDYKLFIIDNISISDTSTEVILYKDTDNFDLVKELFPTWLQNRLVINDTGINLVIPSNNEVFSINENMEELYNKRKSVNLMKTNFIKIVYMSDEELSDFIDWYWIDTISYSNDGSSYIINNMKSHTEMVRNEVGLRKRYDTSFNRNIHISIENNYSGPSTLFVIIGALLLCILTICYYMNL